MRVAVVANRGDGDEGYVGEALADRGARFTRVGRDDPATLSGLEERHDLLVLLGSDWSVQDVANHEVVGAERRLVTRASSRGVPIFAICYGAQLVASALGSAVSRTAHPEIGWRSIDTDAPIAVPVGPWFEYHFDRWSDGGDVTSIARTAAGPQAFWHGRTLAVQFHPEATSDTIRRWLIAGAGEVAGIGGNVDEIIAQSDLLAGAARERCGNLVASFLEAVSASATSSPSAAIS